MPHLQWQSNIFSAIQRAENRLLWLCQKAVKSEGNHLRLGSTLMHKLHGGLTFWDGYRGAQRGRKLHADIKDLQAYLVSDRLTSKGLKTRLPGVVDIEPRWSTITRGMGVADEALRPTHMAKLLIAANEILNASDAQYTGFSRGGRTLHLRMTGSVLEGLAVSGNKFSPKVDWVAVADLARREK